MKEIFKHIGLSFLLALIIFILAIIFDLLEGYCKNTLGLSEWLLFGIRFISVGLFIIDGILILATTVIGAIKIIKELINGK